MLLKDIGVRPYWRAWANRLHDLIMARQWIHYMSPDAIMAWAQDSGLEPLHKDTINMLWYGHELLLFRTAGVASRRN